LHNHASCWLRERVLYNHCTCKGRPQGKGAHGWTVFVHRTSLLGRILGLTHSIVGLTLAGSNNNCEVALRQTMQHICIACLASVPTTRKKTSRKNICGRTSTRWRVPCSHDRSKACGVFYMQTKTRIHAFQSFSFIYIASLLEQECLLRRQSRLCRR
jgi:hypothetical protein